MASSSQPQAGDRISSWGYSFSWTRDHLSREELEPLRQQYDTSAANALERLQAIRATLMEESKAKGTSPPPSDLYVLLRDHRGDDDILAKFWTEVNTVPEWVDWEQLQRGQQFFYRYAIANIVGFALQGFVAENSVCSFLHNHRRGTRDLMMLIRLHLGLSRSLSEQEASPPVCFWADCLRPFSG